MDKILKTLSSNLFSKIDINKIVVITITLILGIFILNLIKLFINKFLLSKSNKQTHMLINKLVTYTGFIIITLFILSELGIQLSTILGAAGVMGIALGIASQKSLGNIISGFFMVTEKSFQIGDLISVAGYTGTVNSVELLSVMLKTFDNKLIRIPNETLISTEITNITKFPIRRIDIEIQVEYSVDLKKVVSILNKISGDNPLILDEPLPFIHIKEFKDSGINIIFGIWFEKDKFIEVKNSLMIDIIDIFREKNIEIPFPHIVIKNSK